MTKIQYAKYKCDNCSKVVEVKNVGWPNNWFEVNISRWCGNSGRTLVSKDVCSKKCVFNMMKKIDKLPEPAALLI